MLHLAAVTLASLLLLVPSSVASAQPGRPAESGPPVVVTTGEATVTRSPDRVWVMIAAESRARSPREAQKLNAAAMAAVMQKLKGAGLPGDAVRTTAYDLQPDFEFHEGRQTVRGYIARNAIEVRLDEVERAGEILEAAVGSGATNVSGLRFDLKDRAAAEREALSLAVADARARAEAAAKGAGMAIDRILRIEERGSAPPPQPFMRTMAAEAASAAPPITPGRLEIKAEVALTAAIR